MPARACRSVLILVLLFFVSHTSARSDLPSPKAVAVAIEKSYKHVIDSMTVPPDELFKLVTDLQIIDTNLELRLTRLLVLLSGWCSFHSFDYFVARLGELTLSVIVDGGGASLADFLVYMQTKGHYYPKISRTPLIVTTLPFTPTKGNLILDSITLRRLHDDDLFRAHVQNHAEDFTFVVPFGYEAINLFNTRRLREQAKAWWQKILDDEKNHERQTSEQDKNEKNTGDDLSWMIQQVERLTLTMIPEDLRSVRTVFIYPPFPFLNDENEKKTFLAANVAQLLDVYLMKNFRSDVPARDQWQLIFDIYNDEPYTQLEIAKTLRAGLFISMTMLGDFSIKLVEQLRIKLDNEAFATAQFIIPKASKSFGFATMMLFMNNPSLSTNNIITVGSAPDKNAPWVVLDDWSGSGESLLSELRELLPRCSSSLTAASFVQSTQAELALSQFVEGNPFGADGKAISMHVLTAFQLNKRHQPDPLKWMGPPGFGDGYYFLSFAYMSPDNDCAFMARIVAPLLTFDGLGAKVWKDHKPPRFSEYYHLSALSRIKPVDVMAAYRAHTPTNYTLCDNGMYPVMITRDLGSMGPPTSLVRLSVLCRMTGYPDGRSTFNWVLTTDNDLVFASIQNNPLQLGVSFIELALYDFFRKKEKEILKERENGDGKGKRKVVDEEAEEDSEEQESLSDKENRGGKNNKKKTRTKTATKTTTAAKMTQDLDIREIFPITKSPKTKRTTTTTAVAATAKETTAKSFEAEVRKGSVRALGRVQLRGSTMLFMLPPDSDNFIRTLISLHMNQAKCEKSLVFGEFSPDDDPPDLPLEQVISACQDSPRNGVKVTFDLKRWSEESGPTPDNDNACDFLEKQMDEELVYGLCQFESYDV